MDVKDYESKGQLAKCFLTNLSDSIKMPNEILTNLKGLGKNLVAVLPGESKKLVFFPTNASQILMIRLFLNKAQLNEDFFASLRVTLAKLGMSNLFSTGVCFKADICVWEGVFEYEDESNFATVQAELEKVKHVAKANFDKIRTND